MNELSGLVIGAAMAVHSELGPGFGESIYEEALCTELRLRGIPFERQVPVELYYRGHVVGNKRLDLIVRRTIVLELKAVDQFAELHFGQLLAYLKATGLPLGLLLNFNAPHLRNGLRRVIRKS